MRSQPKKWRSPQKMISATQTSRPPKIWCLGPQTISNILLQDAKTLRLPRKKRNISSPLQIHHACQHFCHAKRRSNTQKWPETVSFFNTVLHFGYLLISKALKRQAFWNFLELNIQNTFDFLIVKTRCVSTLCGRLNYFELPKVRRAWVFLTRFISKSLKHLAFSHF